jgi:alkaline phosphatase D
MTKLILFFLLPLLALAQGPYLPEGVRVGEVTDDSALVWFRLSPLTHPIPGKFESEPRRAPASLLPDNTETWKLPGAVPGITGRGQLWLATREDMRDMKPAGDFQTGPDRDYTVHLKLEKLRAGRTYYVAVEINEKPDKPHATFTTAPNPRQRAAVRFNTVTGLMYRDLDHDDGFHIFAAMRKNPPSFLVFTGDSVYYDNEPPRAVTRDLARYHWQRMYAKPRHVDLLSVTPQYWMKDDHDTLSDDCWPGMAPDFMLPLTFETGRQLFLEQAPVQDPTFRTFRWGKGLQVWLLEGRDFRSPNNAPDGPGKTILGAKQKEWLKSTVAASDADYKVIISPTPWVGPDRSKKNDNYSNSGFATEGNEMRAWAASQKNVYIVCGDRHWQYHSVDATTGLNEFSVGPASDEHAGGSPDVDKAVQRFHRIKGGYASVEVAPAGNTSKLTFRLHDVQGAPVYEWTAP